MSNRIHTTTRAATSALLTAAALTAAAAQAGSPSSVSESRGYQGCVDAADRQLQMIKVQSDYYIYEHADQRRYYLNGYAFRDGDSTEVKISCATTRSGNRVLEVSVDEGRYAGRVVDPVNVARN